MANSIHTEGFKVSIYDRSIIDSIGQTQKWNFKERIEWICMVLKVSIRLLRTTEAVLTYAPDLQG